MTEGVSHKLDPNGDVLLTLYPPTCPFAPWDRIASAAVLGERLKCSTAEASDERITNGDRLVSSARAWTLDPGEEPEEALPPPPIPCPASPPPALLSEPGLTSPGDSMPATKVTSKARCIKFLLSSRHLALASRYFEMMLKWPVQEATSKSMDGLRHVDASGWDSEAFLLVMKVIHGKFRGIPRCVDLEMLAKIAAIVDYYDCHESLELFSTSWIKDVSRTALPSQCNRDLQLWLLVSFVFREEKIFEEVTGTAIQSSKGLFPMLDQLPVRPSIVDAIDKRRADVIEYILEALDNLIAQFRDGTAGCDFHCSASLLGILLKSMIRHRLSHPAPCRPYIGLSVLGLEESFKAFTGLGHHCRLETFISPRLDDRYKELKAGLELAEFLNDGTTGD